MKSHKAISIDKELVMRELKLSGGILPYHEALYIEAIATSANLCLAANKRFRDGLTEELSDTTLFSFVQDMLSHAAMISKFFWPSVNSPTAKWRGEKLRLAFSLTDDSPLKDRKLRNALEHFDERLDEFLMNSLAGNYFPNPIVCDYREVHDPVNKLFKFIDPEIELAVIMENSFSFGEIAEEVRSILDRCTEFSANGSRFPQ